MKIVAVLALVIAVVVVAWVVTKGPRELATTDQSSEPSPECLVLQQQLADSNTAIESDFIRDIGREKGCWSDDRN